MAVEHLADSDLYFRFLASSADAVVPWEGLANANGQANTLAIVVFTVRSTGPGEYPATITIGGVDAPYVYSQGAIDPTIGTGNTNFLIAAAPLAAGSDTNLTVEGWNVLLLEEIMLVQGIILTNVDTDAFDIAEYAAAEQDSLTLAPISAAPGDMVVAAGGHACADGEGPAVDPAYVIDNGALTATMVTGGETVSYYVAGGGDEQRQGFGYFAIDDALEEGEISESVGYSFIPGIALVITGVAGDDDFNCECDEETNNETLGALRTRMLVRLGYAAQAASPPPGMALLVDDFLRSAQRLLYRRYKELRTERFFTWTMEEGVRMYDLPDNDETCDKRLDPYKLTWVGVEDSEGVWTPLVKGIPPTFYTGVMNNGIPERYEIRQCIEVFPAPTEGYKLRIKGHFGLTALVDDEDQTTIDSELVFLWALGTAKAHYGQPDANSIKSEANIMLGNLVAGTHQTARYVPATWQIPPWTRPLFLPLQDE